MNYQEIFNTAYIGIIKQGRSSTGGEGNCMYSLQMDDGTTCHCAIGMLIKDKVTQRQLDEIENSSIIKMKTQSVVTEILGLDPLLTAKERWFLKALQEAHDGAEASAEEMWNSYYYQAEHNVFFLEEFKEKMLEIAVHNKLTTPKEEEIWE